MMDGCYPVRMRSGYGNEFSSLRACAPGYPGRDTRNRGGPIVHGATQAGVGHALRFVLGGFLPLNELIWYGYKLRV